MDHADWNAIAAEVQQEPSEFASHVEFRHIPELIGALCRVAAEYIPASTSRGREAWKDKHIRNMILAIGGERLVEVIRAMHKEGKL